jgi:hypothetical protein
MLKTFISLTITPPFSKLGKIFSRSTATIDLGIIASAPTKCGCIGGCSTKRDVPLTLHKPTFDSFFLIFKVVFFYTMKQLTWLVTGCTSGFGEALVREILVRGDRVIATGRNASERLKHLEDLGAAILDIDGSCSWFIFFILQSDSKWSFSQPFQSNLVL